MATTLTRYHTRSRWWLEESLDCSHFLVKSEVKPPGISCVRFISAQASAPAHAQRGPEGPETRQPALKVSLMSPGFVSDPYSLSEPISFVQSCFTRSGWKRRKDTFISELKSSYTLAKVRRKYGFLVKFHEETAHIYQEINTLMAKNDKRSLRKFVTENMYCALRNEIKDREKAWVHVHWELIMPMVKIRTVRARLIGTDITDVMKSYAQITVEFLSEQKFEAHDVNGAVVGDKDTVAATYLFGSGSCTRYMGFRETSFPRRVLLASLWKNQGVINRIRSSSTRLTRTSDVSDVFMIWVTRLLLEFL